MPSIVKSFRSSSLDIARIADRLPQGHLPNFYTSDHIFTHLVTTSHLERTKLAKRALRRWSPYFDAIAFTGMSGALIAPPIAHGMKKTLIMVRKEKDNSHSRRPVEGDVAARAYIIVDDLTSSGDTQRRIRKEIKKHLPEAKCLGVLEVDYVTEERIDQDNEHHGKYRLAYANDPNSYYPTTDRGDHNG